MRYYVFDFNSENGRSKKLRMAVAESEKTEVIQRGHARLIKVNIISGNIPHKSWILIPEKEGAIYRRKFWLSSEDVNKALDIINDYEKAKWLKLQEKYTEMEKRKGES